MADFKRLIELLGNPEALKQESQALLPKDPTITKQPGDETAVSDSPTNYIYNKLNEHLGTNIKPNTIAEEKDYYASLPSQMAQTAGAIKRIPEAIDEKLLASILSKPEEARNTAERIAVAVSKKNPYTSDKFGSVINAPSKQFGTFKENWVPGMDTLPVSSPNNSRLGKIINHADQQEFNEHGIMDKMAQKANDEKEAFSKIQELALKKRQGF